MDRLHAKLENFDRITNWLGDMLNKYTGDQKVYKNAIKFQKAFEDSRSLWNLAAKSHHMPKRFRKVFINLKKKEKKDLLNILFLAKIMEDNDCESLISFIDYYYEGNNYLDRALRHYDAALYAFKFFDLGDRGREEFIVTLYTDKEFYHHQVFEEMGIEDQMLIKKLIALETKDKMLNYLTIFPEPLEKYPQLIVTITNYALLDLEEKEEIFEKYGYRDTDELRKEAESEWN